MNPSKTYLRQEMRKYLCTIPDASPEEIADLKNGWLRETIHMAILGTLPMSTAGRCHTFTLSVRSKISLKRLGWD